MNQTAALTAALRAEHAAIYAYGVVGARLDDAARAAALVAFDAHRTRRDALGVALTSRGQSAPGPAASYDVRVAGRPQALALAIRVEVEVAVRWRDLIASTTDAGVRRLAVPALQDCAVRAAQWRKLAGLSPLTTALPGTV